MEKEEEANRLRLFICIFGVGFILTIVCFGIRQLALLEDRIARDHLYHHLELELEDLTDEKLDEFDNDSRVCI